MSRYINIETKIDLEDYKDEIFIYFKNKGIEGNLYDKLKEWQNIFLLWGEIRNEN